MHLFAHPHSHSHSSATVSSSSSSSLLDDDEEGRDGVGVLSSPLLFVTLLITVVRRPKHSSRGRQLGSGLV